MRVNPKILVILWSWFSIFFGGLLTLLVGLIIHNHIMVILGSSLLFTAIGVALFVFLVFAWVVDKETVSN